MSNSIESEILPQQSQNDNTPAISMELFESLSFAFAEFQKKATVLSNAYESMREDFKKVNVELDKKNVELADSLKKQEEMQTYLNSILQSMDNGVIGIDLKGVITHFNRAASEITGFTVQDVLGHSYQEIFGKHDLSNSALLQVLQNGKELKRDEKIIWHHDGHPVQVAYQTAALHDKSGNALGAVEIIADISKIKAIEKEMQQTKTMAALGEMSATVAHEIRNPLGAMGMWAGLLERDLETDDPRRKIVGKIVEGLSRLNKIVSNLLVYTRPIKADLRKVDIGSLLNEIIDFIQIEIERLKLNINVEKKWPTDSKYYVLVDPEKMGQVIMNLCLNSIQAIPSQGTLSVSIDKLSSTKNDLISFSITDTGSGIDQDIISKIFDPFFTTKENGTGLGLAIVKRYVEFHSGYIDIKSEKNKGTSVKVFLPLLKE